MPRKISPHNDEGNETFQKTRRGAMGVKTSEINQSEISEVIYWYVSWNDKRVANGSDIIDHFRRKVLEWRRCSLNVQRNVQRIGWRRTRARARREVCGPISNSVHRRRQGDNNSYCVEFKSIAMHPPDLCVQYLLQILDSPASTLCGHSISIMLS